MAAIRLTDLCKAYHADQMVVDSLNLAIADGEFVSLLGPSGCGKTTTLRLMAGFMAPDRGEITVGDRVVSAPGRVVPPERRRMSMIFQSYALWPHKSVFDNVAFGLELQRVTGQEMKRRVMDALDLVRLAPLAARYPAELSGGQQQRVALARAVVVRPETLLMDEPLSNLDANLREEMRSELRTIHEEARITTIYVTHDQVEALVTSDRVVVMSGGRVEQAGTPTEVFESPRTEFVARFIGRWNVLPAQLTGARQLEIAGRPFALCGDAPMAPPATVKACIRPQQVELIAGSCADAGQNTIMGQVQRQSYLGEQRDYLIDVPGYDLSVRAWTAPAVIFPVGAAVTCRFPPAALRVVEPSDASP